MYYVQFVVDKTIKRKQQVAPKQCGNYIKYLNYAHL